MGVAFLKKKEIKLIKESTLLRVTVGDIVNVKSLKCRGVIRFIGPTKFKSNIIWYGIQLEEAKGKNNGSVDGVKYFQCYPKFGIFVKEEKIEIIERKKKKKCKKTKKLDTIKYYQEKKEENDDPLNEFVEMTNSNKHIARYFMQKVEWDIEAAVDLYHEFDTRISHKFDKKSNKKETKRSLDFDDEKIDPDEDVSNQSMNENGIMCVGINTKKKCMFQRQFKHVMLL